MKDLFIILTPGARDKCALLVAGYGKGAIAVERFNHDAMLCMTNAKNLERDGKIALEPTTRDDFKLATKSQRDHDTVELQGAKDAQQRYRAALKLIAKGQNTGQATSDRLEAHKILTEATS